MLMIVANVYQEDEAGLQRQSLHEPPSGRIAIDPKRAAPADALFFGEIGACSP